MVGVLEMNKSIFGSTFIEKKASRRARKAMAMDLMVPSNAVELTSEEMEYIDGGWTNTYRGFDGWIAVAAIAFNIYASASLTATLFASAAAAAATVIGVIWSCIAAIGGTITMANTFIASANLCLAIGFMLSNNGFNEIGWSFFGVGFYIVTPL